MMLLNILFGALVVVLGALGIHLPPESLGPSNIDRFQVAQRYHMFHVLVVLIEGALIGNGARDIFLKTSMVFIMLGILFFCGSLYANFFFRFDYLEFLTPIGGCFFVIGWIIFFLAFATREKIV